MFNFQTKELQLGNYAGSDLSFEGCIGGVIYDHTFLPLNINQNNDNDNNVENGVYIFFFNFMHIYV